MKLVNLLPEYEEYQRGRRLKEGTIDRNLRVLRFFHDSCLEFEREDLRELQEKDFIHFVDTLRSRSLSGETINLYLSGVRQFFIWLYKNDLILLLPSWSLRSKQCLRQRASLLWKRWDLFSKAWRWASISETGYSLSFFIPQPFGAVRLLK